MDQVTVRRGWYKVGTGWYTIGGVESELISSLAAQDRHTSVEEDVRLVESIPRGLGSLGYRPGSLVIDPKGGVKSEHSMGVLHLARYA